MKISKDFLQNTEYLQKHLDDKEIEQENKLENASPNKANRIHIGDKCQYKSTKSLRTIF